MVVTCCSYFEGSEAANVLKKSNIDSSAGGTTVAVSAALLLAGPARSKLRPSPEDAAWASLVT